MFDFAGAAKAAQEKFSEEADTNEVVEQPTETGAEGVPGAVQEAATEDQPEAEATDTGSENVTESDPQDPPQPDQRWSGKLEDLDDEQRAMFMRQSDYTKKTTDLAREREDFLRQSRELEELRAKVAEQEKPSDADNGPPLPSDQDSPEEYVKKWDARVKWQSEQAVLKHRGDTSEVDQLVAQNKLQARVNLVRGMDGYDADVEATLIALADEDDSGLYDQLMETDAGAKKFFEIGKKITDLQKSGSKASDEALAKAKAADDETIRKSKAGSQAAAPPQTSAPITSKVDYSDKTLKERWELAKRDAREEAGF